MSKIPRRTRDEDTLRQSTYTPAFHPVLPVLNMVIPDGVSVEILAPVYRGFTHPAFYEKGRIARVRVDGTHITFDPGRFGDSYGNLIDGVPRRRGASTSRNLVTSDDFRDLFPDGDSDLHAAFVEGRLWWGSNTAYCDVYHRSAAINDALLAPHGNLRRAFRYALDAAGAWVAWTDLFSPTCTEERLMQAIMSGSTILRTVALANDEAITEEVLVADRLCNPGAPTV